MSALLFLSLGLLSNGQIATGSVDYATRTGATGTLPDLEAAARGFPALYDLQGTKLAEGDFVQWLENEHLYVKITYEFGSEHRVEEQAVFRQKPQLVQDHWSWRETRNGQLERQFAVDFDSHKATATKRERSATKQWSEDIKGVPGRTFAGFGFTLALKSLRERLVKGEKIELQAVGFTPKPRVVSVVLSFGGLDQLPMAERTLRAERFAIHPKLPWVARPFVDIQDTHIWLNPPRPSGFLRWEGPLAEPSDAVVRVDLLPAKRSEAAQPVAQ